MALIHTSVTMSTSRRDLERKNYHCGGDSWRGGLFTKQLKKWVKTVFLLGCYWCIFHGTGNSVQFCQNFRISGVFEPPKPTPLGTPLITDDLETLWLDSWLFEVDGKTWGTADRDSVSKNGENEWFVEGQLVGMCERWTSGEEVEDITESGCWWRFANAGCREVLRLAKDLNSVLPRPRRGTKVSWNYTDYFYSKKVQNFTDTYIVYVSKNSDRA